MNINSVQGLAQLYRASQLGSVSRTQAVSRASKADEFVISSEGQTFSDMLQELKSMDEARPEKVAAYEQQLGSGHYDVSSENVAASLLNLRF